MLFIKSFDVWSTSAKVLKTMQPGQHVYAGDVSQKGIYCGIKKSGTIVVAWRHNIQSRNDKKGYVRSLINYAKRENP
jgi:hypothetical protein